MEFSIDSRKWMFTKVLWNQEMSQLKAIDKELQLLISCGIKFKLEETDRATL